MSKRRKSGDVPSKADMKAFSASLGDFIDRRGLRTPGERAFIKRVRDGVKRREEKDQVAEEGAE
jgi:hypothetical protein